MPVRTHLLAVVLGAATVTASYATFAAAPASAATTFDVASIPLAPAPPAFPFVDWPAFVPADQRTAWRTAAFDALPVIAGTALVTLEGRLEERRIAIPEGRSPHELRRYYRDRIGAMGGVQVNRLQPVSDGAVVVDAVAKLFPADANPATQLALCGYDEGRYQYEVYAIRSESAQAWVVVQTSTWTVCVTSIAVEPE